MSGLAISAQTREAQAAASDPASSVFVAANAGSGKTFVLSRRVVRLLVSGVEPSRILCLTYTKAAAAEMQGRVFRALGDFVRAPDDALRATLAELGAATGPEALARARRLFATALETPGGLKVQTIHAFCEQLLHLFPLEAGVPGHFEVLDDAGSAILLAEARRRLIAAAGGDGRPDLAEAFAEILILAGEKGLDDLLKAIVGTRDAIRSHLDAMGDVEAAVAALAGALALDPHDDEETILGTLGEPTLFDAGFRADLAAAASGSAKVTDEKLVAKLADVAAAATSSERHRALRAIVLKADGERYAASSIVTKAVADQFADFPARLDALATFVTEADERLATLRLFRASRAALILADRLEGDYQDLKRGRARLDFEDLIVRTADLLTLSEASAWVHYKLDRGIDHVLVDEAQDTSPRQWQVVRQLVEEFFAGETERPRTLFAVGDEKQSIYSFQGASPTMFAAERDAIEQRARAAARPFGRVSLHQSFRSAGTVLKAVDDAFAAEPDRRGLTFDGSAPVHETARGQAPGLVEIWPLYRAEKAPESDDWLKPIDEEPRASPVMRLAARIAATIEGWIGTPLEHRGVTRAMGPGDVAILVRKRSGFVGAMSAALRERGIGVAGADRLVITEHIAVQDLMALGRAVANAEDELSLAAVLKSPLFGFSDDELTDLALSRDAESPESLYLALRRVAASDGAGRPADAFARLEALRAREGFSGVFDFYARILGSDGGRRLLTARLGRDSGEVIDAFLDLALAFDREGAGGLDAFLADLEASPATVKREMGEARDEVRIMTVHAAKGLEAPVVFLVDPGSAPFSATHGARLIRWDAVPGLPPGAPPAILFSPGKASENAVVKGLREAEKRRAEDEYRRLLYVGLTRAADRLVVCGHAGVRAPSADIWLTRVTVALAPGAVEVRDAAGDLIALRRGALPEGGGPDPDAGVRDETLAPIDLSPLPQEVLPPRPLVPSDPVGAARIEAEDDAGARSPVLASAEPSLAIRRGLLMHRLLQALPDVAAKGRAAAAAAYLDRSGAEFDQASRAALAASALAILEDPRFSAIFAPGSRAEVGVRGTVRVGARDWPVSGTIDRIAATAGSVLVVDYKTNRPPPDDIAGMPASHVLQLALYRALLAPLYPGRAIEAALLYTEAPRLIAVPGTILDEGLERLSGGH